MRSPIFVALLALLLGFPGAAIAALDSAEATSKELRIVRITPEGVDVPSGRQIVIEFNRPVVPVGRMERTAEEIPISIKPALKCEWRWLDTSSLSCNLGEKDALVPSTTYEVDIQPGIRAEDGVTIAEPLTHRFTTERTLTMDLLHKYGPDYRLIFVGDAAMSPYEIEMEGGSVEYSNSETGKVWLQRMTNHFKRVAWLNPMPERSWEYTYSTDIIKNVMGGRMYPTTVQGLTDAMKALAK